MQPASARTRATHTLSAHIAMTPTSAPQRTPRARTLRLRPAPTASAGSHGFGRLYGAVRLSAAPAALAGSPCNSTAMFTLVYRLFIACLSLVYRLTGSVPPSACRLSESGAPASAEGRGAYRRTPWLSPGTDIRARGEVSVARPPPCMPYPDLCLI